MAGTDRRENERPHDYANFPGTTGMEAVSPPSIAKTWPFT